MNIKILALLAVLPLAAGCSARHLPTEPAAVETDISALCSMEYGACAPVASPVMPGSSITDAESISFTGQGGAMKMSHLAVPGTCGALSVAVTVKKCGSAVNIYESVTYPQGATANCPCVYDFYAVIPAIETGKTYTVNIYLDGAARGSYTVTGN